MATGPSIAQIISEIISYLRVSNNEFARMIQSSSTVISAILRSKNSPSFPFLQGIHRNLPQVNMEWVLTGEGPMLRSLKDVKAMHGQTGLLAPPDAPPDSIEVKMLNVKAQAGLASGQPDHTYFDELPTVYIPSLMIQGRWRDVYAIQVNGASMEPTIFNGDWLCCTRTTLEAIRPGEVYVLNTEEGILCKRPKPLGNGLIELRSDNPDFGPFNVQASQVYTLWLVHGLIRLSMPGKWV